MKTQVFVIHGGESFKNHRQYLRFLRRRRIDFGRYKKPKDGWKRKLGAALGKKYEVILPDMPNKTNAKYNEWKIWFEKFTPHMRSGVVLIGHSLGALFLIKYLSESKFSKKISAVFLVAPPWSEGDFTLRSGLEKFERQSGKIFIYWSKNDKIVPFAALKKYQKNLTAPAWRVFKNRGHFNQEKFPELIKDVKSAI